MVTVSKINSRRELQIPGSITGRTNGAEGTAAESHGRISEVGSIGEIEGIDLHHELEPFVYAECTAQAGIEVIPARPAQAKGRGAD